MQTDTQRVHLIDDDDSLRTALTRVLRAGGYEVCSYAAVADFLISREKPLRGCMVLDIRMPGGPGGLELQRALVRQGETLPVIFLTGHGDISTAVGAMREGAFDFLTKPVERETLLAVVRSAMESEEKSWQKRLRQHEIATKAAGLTPKERAVFRALVEGRLNKQIADILDCSERTVKAHRARLMAKMGANSLADLIQLSGSIHLADG